jgi:hypothetical protein
MPEKPEKPSAGAADLDSPPTTVTYPKSGRKVLSEDFPLRGFTRHASAEVDPNARLNAERSNAWRAKERRSGNGRS